MKKIILFLWISFLFGSSCLAQYIPIFGYNDNWQQQDYGNVHDCHANNITQNVSNTATYNNQVYQVIHETWNLPITDNTYYLREDCNGEKVYIYDLATNQESLYYDFTLTIPGQTVTVYDAEPPHFPVTLTVWSISTDASSRKHIVLVNPHYPTGPYVEWVEGLGSLSGIVNNTVPYTLNNAYDTKLLLCHSRNGIQDYTPMLSCSSYACSTTVDPNAPNVTVSAQTGNSCVGTSYDISGTFGGVATGVTATHDGQGTISSPVINGTGYSITYTPVAGDVGNVVIITIRTSTPGLSACIEDFVTVALTVNASPQVPSVSVSCTNNPGTLTINSPTGSGEMYQLDAGTFQSGTTFLNVPNGQHSVTVRNFSGCTNANAITVNCNVAPCTLPLVSAAGTNNQTVCLGQAITPIQYDLTGTGYTGVGGGGQPLGVSTNLQGNIFIFSGTPTQTGVFTYTVTANSSPTNPCNPWTATGTITVLPPAVSVNSVSICNGQSATLTATGGSGYTWSTGATTTSITVSPSVTTTYTVSNASGGCTGSTEAVVTVNPLPTVGVNSPTICDGQTATLTGTGATEYTWTGGLTGSPTATTPVLHTTTTYTVTGTDANNCSATAVSTVTVNPNATLTLVSGNPNQTKCINNPIDDIVYSFTGASTASVSGLPPGVNYSYTPAGILTISGSPNSMTNSPYTFTVTTNGPCPATATGQITVSNCNCPTLSLTGQSTNVCGASAVTITGTFSDAANVTFSENGAGSLNTASTTSSNFSIVYTPTSADLGNNVIVTATANPVDGSCSPVVRTFTINYFSNTLTIGVNSPQICPGATATLTATGAITYSWSGGLGNGNPVTTPVLNAGTSYNVTGFSTSACGVGTATITLTTLPTIAASETNICIGASATLTVNGAATYSAWTPTTGLSGSGKTVMVSPTVNTTYNVTATTSNGCARALSIPITVQNCGSCCANTCPWTLSGNGAVNAPTRGTVGLTPSCTVNNFIGTRTGNQAENNDLVFGANGLGYMRLTTDGGLFLTDFPRMWGAPNSQLNGNIKLGCFAGYSLTLNGAGPQSPNTPNNSNILIGQNTARDATIAWGNIMMGNNIGVNAAAPLTNLRSGNIFIGSNIATNMHGEGPCNGSNGLDLNAWGSQNIAIGNGAAQNLRCGGQNIFLGMSSGAATTEGARDVFIGSQTGVANTTGSNNTFLGFTAGSRNTTAGDNTFVGNNAGQNISTGGANVYVGSGAGSGAYTNFVANTGTENVVVGYSTGTGITTGSRNTYLGAYTAGRNYVGNNNTYVGYGVGGGIGVDNIGSNNTCVGSLINMSGDNNVCLGAGAGQRYGAPSNQSNCIAIGNVNFLNGDFGISIGTSTDAGMNRTTAGTHAIAIGSNARAFNTNSIAIGQNSSTNMDNSIVIGRDALCTNLTAGSTPNCFIIGTFATAGATNITTPPLKVGIGTAGPTTRLHINCVNDPRNPLPTPGSAVRFEGLQTASTCTGMSELVIDNNGYVMKKLASCPAARTSNIDSLSQRTDSLLRRIDILEQKILTMERDMDKCCTKSLEQTIPIKDIKLYQNVPNPFNQTTEIRFFIPELVKKASLVIYDLNGRELRKMDINDRNDSSIKIYGKELAAGMYIYTLIADDNEVDSKRMILTGN